MMSLAKGERLSTTSTLDDNLLIAIGWKIDHIILKLWSRLSINAYSHLGITLIPKQTLLVQDRWDIRHLYTSLMTIWFQGFSWPVAPTVDLPISKFITSWIFILIGSGS